MNSTLSMFRFVTLVAALLTTAAIRSHAASADLYASTTGYAIDRINPQGVASNFAAPSNNIPIGLAFDTAGNLYAADYGSDSITKYTSSGVATVFASTGLDLPVGLAFDKSGNLYAANYGGNTIERFAPGGAASVFASTGQHQTPRGLAFDGTGNLYISCITDGTILKITPGGVETVFASNQNGPDGLACDSAGNLYAALYGSSTIVRYTPGGSISVFASTGLDHPEGLAFDSSGNLYAASSLNASTSGIEKFSSDGTDLGRFSSDRTVFLAFQVPEPSTWLMMFLGVCVLWFALRRTRPNNALQRTEAGGGAGSEFQP